ncbi:hypothetical protein F3Y22_tig00116964pilonHSYRG00197 [Hibiscus syriacus]|uniref:Uncharacterized protein n=1 Tax=Hibiscus syriacus TaxID=106335 RepID=A0A6A2WVG5_HIBSY|nr:hypothetical protein F3Y22_tig00116964pilonHSYRG00197 [Hibiscus syriacus]
MDVDGGVMVLGEITPPKIVFFHSDPFRSPYCTLSLRKFMLLESI